MCVFHSTRVEIRGQLGGVSDSTMWVPGSKVQVFRLGSKGFHLLSLLSGSRGHHLGALNCSSYPSLAGTASAVFPTLKEHPCKWGLGRSGSRMSQAWICIPSPSMALVLGKYLLAVLIVLASRFVSAIVLVRSYNNLKMMLSTAMIICLSGCC